jgi:bacterial/archaeal transporter family-2 protein
MTPDTVRFAAIMLLAGIGIPVLAALNAQLGNRIGSPAAAATILFVIAFCVSGAALVVTAGLQPLGLIAAQPKYLLLGGFLVAFYVLSITWIAPRFGVGNAVFCVLMGQLISAALIDQFGLFGALIRPVSMVRAFGIGLMALGVFLTQRV